VDSNSVIMSSAIVTLGSTTAASMLPKEYGGKGEIPSPKLLIGTSLSFLGLSILGGFAPQLANPLSIAMAFTALTYYGFPVLNKVFTEVK
jgi:hypothetical protein